jgi:hypothetical protein
LADTRGLTGAEIGALGLKAREAEAEAEDNGVLVLDRVPNSPPRPVGESQGVTSISLAIRSPKAPPRAPPPRGSIATGRPIFRLPREDLVAPPASTAPPRLAESEGRLKRKRAHTHRYEEGVASGDIDESQHGALGRP